MKYVEIIAADTSAKTILAIAEKAKATDVRLGAVEKDGMQQMRMLVDDENLQLALDTLQNVLGAQPHARIIVLPVEASLPKPKADEQPQKKGDAVSTARESLYEEVSKGARLDADFLLLVVLSTVVAAIGLIENNIAVVIGAMLIAPLLGPNLALSLGTALGDVDLMKTSIKTLIVGIALAVAMSVVFGLLWPTALDNHELMSRTSASLDAIALALASGAAATLSLTTGVSGVLVGVMVAVALLPPAVTLGLMLGHGRIELAVGAGLLLSINIVCVNLASKIVFFAKGIRPRTWFEKEKANQTMTQYVIGWLVILVALLVFIYLRSY